jgi:hypothetical protein
VSDDEVFRAPEDPTERVTDEAIGEVRVPVILPIAAFCALVSALFTLAAGLQGLTTITYSPWSWLRYGPYVYLGLGGIGLAAGGRVYTGHLRSAVASLAQLALTAAFAAVWSLYHLTLGALVPLPMCAAALAVLGAALVAASLPACARLTRQRAMLYSDQGL